MKAQFKEPDNDEDVTYSTGDNNSLSIIFARYDSPDYGPDITDHLNNLINDGTLSTTANNTLAGKDPVAGSLKQLDIKYRTTEGEIIYKSYK